MSSLVSVVIPSYNHAQYISTAIESVLAQTHGRWELIVVDDGSRDDTERALTPYMQNDRIRIILNKENRGQSFVVNQALAIANGEFVCFLPSDDWYLPEKLELQVAKFHECDQSVGVVYGRGARFYESTGETIEVDLRMRRGWVLRDLIVGGNFVYPITPMFRKSCFDAVRFDESYRAEGEAIYLKIARKFQFDYVDAVVGVMRDHDYNTGKNIEMMYDDNLRYWTEFFAQSGLPSDVRNLESFCISRLQRLKGLELISLRHEFAGGRDMLVRAIATRPRTALDIRVVGGIAISLMPERWAKAALRKWRSAG